jgi:hypothetical protein
MVDEVIQGTKFDPAKHMRKLAGKDYLEVCWRLVWAQMDNDTVDIITELVDLRMGDEGAKTDFALFKAEVNIPGKGKYVAYGSETRGDFLDFIEKAGTKAVGRALGLAGYGTQFADDWVFDPSNVGKVVDSPVDRQLAAAQSRAGLPPGRTSPTASQKQLDLITTRSKGKETIVVDFLASKGVSKETISVRQASELIDLLAA